MTYNAPAKKDTSKAKLLVEFKHNRPLTSCHWVSGSRFVFFGAEDNLVHRFELSSGKVKSLAAHDSWVRSFGSSPDGKVVYSGGYDGRVIFWPTAADQPKPIRVIHAHQGWVRAIAVHPRGTTIATCGNDRLVKLWDAATGKLIRTFSGHESHVYNLVFTQNGEALVSCDLKGVVCLHTAATGSSRRLLTVEALHGYDTTFRADIGGARSIALHSKGKQVALGGISKVTNAFAGVGEIVVALVNLSTGKLDRLLRSKDKARGATWGIAHHPSGFWIGLSGGGGGRLWFWKEGQDEPFSQLKLKSDGRGMSLSPDRTKLCVAHADNRLRTYGLIGVS